MLVLLDADAFSCKHCLNLFLVDKCVVVLSVNLDNIHTCTYMYVCTCTYVHVGYMLSLLSPFFPTVMQYLVTFGCLRNTCLPNVNNISITDGQSKSSR